MKYLSVFLCAVSALPPFQGFADPANSIKVDSEVRVGSPMLIIVEGLNTDSPGSPSFLKEYGPIQCEIDGGGHLNVIHVVGGRVLMEYVIKNDNLDSTCSLVNPFYISIYRLHSIDDMYHHAQHA